MTIHLPNDLNLFRQAFDETCDRILNCESDAAFYKLILQLIANIRDHLLLKNCFVNLEADSEKRQQDFDRSTIEALEDIWKRLWKYHSYSLTQRKRLARIKGIVTNPKEIISSPLYERILFSLREFRSHSPIFRVLNEAPAFFHNAQSEIKLAVLRCNHRYPSIDKHFANRKIGLCKFSMKKDKRRKLHIDIISKLGKVNPPLFKWSVEKLPSALFSPMLAKIEQAFAPKGRTESEKRQEMHGKAETDFVFCWERFRFLKRYSISNGTFPTLKPFKGSWDLVRKTAWKAARERCELETILWGKMLPGQSLSLEYRIHRKDFERYIRSLKSHIHAELFNIANLQENVVANIEQNVINDTSSSLPGTQKWNFVVDLASKYWKSHPRAKYDEVFGYYCTKCPYGKILSRTRWEQIIRERKLDPRPRREKKRGPGKKTLQN